MKFLIARAKETYNSNKYIKIGLRVLISGALILWLIKNQDVEAIKTNLIAFDWGYLLLASAFLALGTYISAYRWKAILNTSNKNISVWELFALYLKGYFYNNFLPTQMGGDVYKAVAAGKIINDQSLGFFSVFMDRFSGLVLLLILGLFGISSLYGIWWVIFSLVALVSGFYLYFPVLKLFAGKIKFFQKFDDASRLLLNNKKEAAIIILNSLFVQLLSFATTYILFLGMDIALTFQDVFAYMPIANLSSLIPSFNGFGTQETVFAFLFKSAGVTPEISITISLMVHIMRLVMSAIGGMFIVLNVPKGSNQN